MTCHDHIARARTLANAMRALSDELNGCEHHACLALDGAMRDDARGLLCLADHAERAIDDAPEISDQPRLQDAPFRTSHHSHRS